MALLVQISRGLARSLPSPSSTNRSNQSLCQKTKHEQHHEPEQAHTHQSVSRKQLRTTASALGCADSEGISVALARRL